MFRGHKSLLAQPEPNQSRIEFILEFWTQLRISGETGMTTWDELVPLERAVMRSLSRSDWARAESFTANAMHLIAGCCDDH
jgi:hypothetical protein